MLRAAIQIAPPFVSLTHDVADDARAHVLDQSLQSRRELLVHVRAGIDTDHLLNRALGVGGSAERNQTECAIAPDRLPFREARGRLRIEPLEQGQRLLVRGLRVQALRIRECRRAGIVGGASERGGGDQEKRRRCEDTLQSHGFMFTLTRAGSVAETTT